MEDRKQHVLEVAQQLFLEKGFSQTSIQDIIRNAAISKGTFYNYFTSKNECLITILKHAQKEAFDRRKQLLQAHKKDDRTIFAKQIVIRMQVNQEQNILPLFGFVFHSKDQELRTFAKTYHLQEIAWLSERFIDVYGEQLYSYAVDCAVFVLGLTQQYSLVWSFYIEDEVNIEALITFILQRMNAIVADFLKEEDSFIHDTLFQQVESIWQTPDETVRLINEFKAFAMKSLKEDDVANEYATFIIEELQKKAPRVHLLHATMDTLCTHYQKDPLQKTLLEWKERLLKEFKV